jgi:hypothetical protein
MRLSWQWCRESGVFRTLSTAFKTDRKIGGKPARKPLSDRPAQRKPASRGFPTPRQNPYLSNPYIPCVPADTAPAAAATGDVVRHLMTPLPSLPIRRILTDNADHGGGRCVPLDIPTPASGAANPTIGATRPSDRPSAYLRVPSSLRQRPHEPADRRHSAPCRAVAGENNSHSPLGRPV